MLHATLEHVNYCTPDPPKTAEWMADVFGWKIRWRVMEEKVGAPSIWAETTTILRCTSRHIITVAERLCNGWPDEPYWRFGQ